MGLVQVPISIDGTPHVPSWACACSDASCFETRDVPNKEGATAPLFNDSKDKCLKRPRLVPCGTCRVVGLSVENEDCFIKHVRNKFQHKGLSAATSQKISNEYY